MDTERQLVKFSDLDFKYQLNEDEFRPIHFKYNVFACYMSNT